MSAKTLMVMAGGTGGHVYPAMAVADHLKAQGWNIVWLATEGGMENRLIEGKGYQKANNLFFKTNLLDQWTRFVQLASFGTGKNLIKRLKIFKSLFVGAFLVMITNILFAYVFEIKVRDNLGEESQVDSFSFNVLPPWYRSTWAYVLYFAIFIIIILLIYNY